MSNWNAESNQVAQFQQLAKERIEFEKRRRDSIQKNRGCIKDCTNQTTTTTILLMMKRQDSTSGSCTECKIIKV
jgi:hypothetical protein